MTNKYNAYLLLSLLFLGENVLSSFYIDLKLFFTVILLFSIFICTFHYSRLKKYQAMISLSAFVLLYGAFKLVIDTSAGTRQLILTIAVPPLAICSFLCPNISNYKEKIVWWRCMFKLVMFFYLTECSLSIVERIIEYNFFEWNVLGNNEHFVVDNISDFRSFSLHGHPLYNALIVTTIMNYILISPLKISYKLFLWIIGFFAIACFNTRSSIIGNALFLIIYFFYQLFRTRVKDSIKIRYSVWLIIIATFILYALFGLGFGGRILNNELMDDSGMSRIILLNMFNYVSLDQLLFGMDNQVVVSIMQKCSIRIIENFWIIYLFRLGLVFLVIYFILYVRVMKLFFYRYNKFDVFFVTTSFLVIATANNSLATNPLALFLFIFCAYLFNPRLLIISLPFKYIQYDTKNYTSLLVIRRSISKYYSKMS